MDFDTLQTLEEGVVRVRASETISKGYAVIGF